MLNPKGIEDPVQLMISKDDLIERAAELFTRYITVAPPEYHQDLREWLRDAGLDEVKK